MTDAALPPDFASRREAGATLIARSDLLEALRGVGLGTPAGWVARLAVGTRSRSGRGSTATLALPTGERLRLKQLRRGGLAGPLWRERFPGLRRLRENLSVPLAAARRGVATPEPIALLVVPGPPGLYRAWMALAEVAGAVDLLERFLLGSAPGDAEIAAALAQVRRMHDAGVDHVDLNLGNLLVRGSGADLAAFVIDLDRARLHDGPLPTALRRAALARLDRSFRKNLPGVAPPDWRAVYAEGDAALARALAG